MRRGVKISLILAAILTVAGGAVCLAGLGILGFDLSGFAAPAQTRNYEVVQEVTSISVEVDTADVTLLPATDGVCRIVCKERGRLQHTMSLQEGRLEIRVADTRKWYDHIGIFTGETSVTLYLPEGEYGELSVKTDTGDVAVPADMSFTRVSVETDTGDVQLQSKVAQGLTVGTHTGDVTVVGASFGQLSVTTTTGDVSAQSVAVAEGVVLNTDTGEVTLTDLSCKQLSLTTDTGDVTLSRTLVTEQMAVKTDTGDVTLTDCDAAGLQIKTNTGDVEGSLRTDKIFRATSDTGDISVPDTVAGGICAVETDTGDITLRIGQ